MPREYGAGMENQAREARRGLQDDSTAGADVGVEKEELSVGGQAYFLTLVRLESARAALSGMRIVGQNKAGSGSLHQQHFV